MNKQTIQNYLETYKKGLLENIIPFWTKHSIDWEDGGFNFCLDRDGTVIDTDKGVWQTGRFTWMILTLYNEVEQKEEWLKIGKHGIDFLEKHCYDENGKMYFIVDKQGEPIRMRRYVFSESFAAIAYAAYYKATGIEEYKEKAKEAFDTFLRYNTTPGLIAPKFTDNRKMRGMGGPMIGIVTAQELRKNLNDNSYTTQITEWINEIQKYFLNHEYKAVMEAVGLNGELVDHFDGRTLNPGHAIEGAWFILQEAKLRNNNPELIKLGTTMLDWMWEIGWDKEYGGMLYFKDVKGLPIQEYWHDMKFWWPHNETVIATLMAYELTGDKKYAEMHKQVHDWTFKHFPDQEHGEWYGYLHRDGRISVPLKGNIWKGPFHIPRMYLMAWKSCERMSLM
ncbi:MAG: N-acylglucosamine 2-epimerase [Prolixibacteraceae bacterium]|jgi:N-acylglucosamine 2-epimerase|nr:N-acylglucosamine 2-epimerase [Prolixibacteraceae bacterium]MBT6766852.1 N-acylglucosamine 2-epimerase [Prolixibacteraceae bacterium]MBT6998231.1 N-acylglucosamine 2-epimerase [Prolixibacteraceae bacterium]MBT7394153.1 N-acylglucosamine 2-epimerase [Prolixibacteraceae bacterium]